ncbi:hypothetical protein [Streptomyces cupreus]|uniref:Discoidin domain-containing protein n=1 Tax=Streptomyces cupreus TaxID=2759956 RepID=A0A7X1J8A6_9ACTN|nr:hypothetical protein [Streptomyces cupreus]MBC2903522.1 hypothetical protein [Streptomyces cupreus]
MPTIQALAGGNLPNQAQLSNAQTGNGASTNIVDRGAVTERPALLKVTTTVGATPTCTYAIEGSADGTNWFAVAYADSATPETVSVATFAITTATTAYKILRPGHPWRYLRITYSANTNVTNTADLYAF